MLFKDTSKLKEYAEFTDINFASVKLTIRQVEEGQLIPIIGNELYSSLNNAYALATNENTLSAAHQNLLDMCRMVIGAYVTYNYAPKADVQLSDSGARRAETGTHKTAFAYQVVNFREQKLREAEAAIESLLRFLSTNSSSYPEWVASEAYKQYKSLFIKTGSEFDFHFRTASPYRNYWAWRYKMYDVEQQVILPALGEDLFEHLKEVDAAIDGVYTAEEVKLLLKLKKAIAYLTVSFAIPLHSVRFDANGITVISADSTVNKDQELRASATADQISQTTRNTASSGQQWLDDAIKYIIANPDAFPDYPLPDDESEDDCDFNNNLNGSYGLI